MPAVEPLPARRREDLSHQWLTASGNGRQKEGKRKGPALRRGLNSSMFSFGQPIMFAAADKLPKSSRPHCKAGPAAKRGRPDQAGWFQMMTFFIGSSPGALAILP